MISYTIFRQEHSTVIKSCFIIIIPNSSRIHNDNISIIRHNALYFFPWQNSYCCHIFDVISPYPVLF